MTIEQNYLFQIFDLIAPPELAEPWDNVGPQIIPEGQNRKINKILLCLDCYEPVIQEALKIGAELILSHHPLIFSPLSRLIYNQYPCNLINNIICSGMSLFVMHTNLDKAIGGINEHLASMVGLDDIFPLTLKTTDDSAILDKGLGRIGNFSKPRKLKALCQEIKESLDLQSIRFIGDPHMEVKRMAVCSGSGASLIQETFKKGAQALLTGDVKYHQAREAQGHKIALIDGGHFATERIILPALKKRIKDMIFERGYGKDLEIYISATEEDPFQEL
ncbi:MAG: Nif3-like dinuclear metal center hexameric protein [bacterium]